MCEYVYAALHENALIVRVMGERRNISCAVCDLRSDRSSDTRANDCVRRASFAAIAPVVATMLVGCTNTGRLSSANAKRVFGWKLMSTVRCWFRLYEYVPSTYAE